ncbi:MAG: transglutaminase-like domain-containing protein [Candidatus Hodarchaeales archaeon]
MMQLTKHQWKTIYNLAKAGWVILAIFVLLYITENPISHYIALKEQENFQQELIDRLYSNETIEGMSKYFDRPYNYTELITWTHNQLEVVDKKPDPLPKTPFEILELGEGRCGEFSILYCSACIANGYDARLVMILRGSNHEWVEVMINGEWVHVDPTNPPYVHVNDPLMYLNRGKKLHLVVAFGLAGYEDVTEKYNQSK